MMLFDYISLREHMKDGNWGKRFLIASVLLFECSMYCYMTGYAYVWYFGLPWSMVRWMWSRQPIQWKSLHQSAKRSGRIATSLFTIQQTLVFAFILWSGRIPYLEEVMICNVVVGLIAPSSLPRWKAVLICLGVTFFRLSRETKVDFVFNPSNTTEGADLKYTNWSQPADDDDDEPRLETFDEF